MPDQTAPAPAAPRAGDVRTLGILGGGQLGRMLALAAARLGLKCHILCPDPISPAFEVAADHIVAAYDDEAALARFAAGVDVITYEFENVPAATAAFLAGLRPVRPGTLALGVAQDRCAEKQFLAGLGIATAPFRAIDDLPGLIEAMAEIGYPAILKTRRLGYDGKGQARITSPDDIATAFAAMAGHPAILEGFVPFAREVSVIAARGVDGAVASFDIAENEHRDHVLKFSHVPAAIRAETEAAARAIGERVAAALDYVGVIAVELFVVETEAGESLVANEIAPRVHNSGHWTEAACLVSQFEQHMRAVAGLPLGNPARHFDLTMENLLGDDVLEAPAILAEADAVLHLYGKHERRAGRKMGHVTRVRPRADRN